MKGFLRSCCEHRRQHTIFMMLATEGCFSLAVFYAPVWVALLISGAYGVALFYLVYGQDTKEHVKATRMEAEIDALKVSNARLRNMIEEHISGAIP